MTIFDINSKLESNLDRDFESLQRFRWMPWHNLNLNTSKISPWKSDPTLKNIGKHQKIYKRPLKKGLPSESDLNFTKLLMVAGFKLKVTIVLLNLIFLSVNRVCLPTRGFQPHLRETSAYWNFLQNSLICITCGKAFWIYKGKIERCKNS